MHLTFFVVLLQLKFLCFSHELVWLHLLTLGPPCLPFMVYLNYPNKRAQRFIADLLFCVSLVGLKSGVSVIAASMKPKHHQ